MSTLYLPVSAIDHVQGASDAPVTLVEYGDFQCPYCGAMHQVIKEIQRVMGAKLRFVFRHFPLTELHEHALRAARFAEAGATVERFWKAHDILFDNQADLSDGALDKYARLAGIPGPELAAAFEGAHDARIQRDYTSGVRSDVQGTPTLFINEVRYDGAHDIESLLAAMQRV
ncbi:thioredoxin domain-containing protein [Caballeronia sp. LZ035]|uniref:DsbA family protein n=1 Tax=Caballeronia sp. LZ035 TaxID=3038568 RepID=UPI002854E535|nr:thioredoxin domain-containing protein [Caballeronia sp. LZ035]MDR5760864.1 thioredoxin domain-containing protein [Caballeronia sp. LZ035]